MMKSSVNLAVKMLAVMAFAVAMAACANSPNYGSGSYPQGVGIPFPKNDSPGGY